MIGRTETVIGAIERVVTNGNCSGCGACAALVPAVEMQLSAEGFLRPRVSTGVGSPPASAHPTDRSLRRDFRAMCPGVGVTEPARGSRRRHEILGPFVSAWSAWSTDPEIRFLGSSGGVITALSDWLIREGRTGSVLAAGATPDVPSRTVPLTLRTRSEVLAAAGSRYAPVANASTLDVDTPVFVGKPCEVSAARRFPGRTGPGSPLLLSFFCAGVPSQKATDQLVADLGMAVDDLTTLRYRGHGWPGSFTIEDGVGGHREMSYDESWGQHLGRSIQDRCKICPDGTGGHADISVGDYWETDAAGFPSFENGDGVSVAIARTQRGHDLLLAARQAGAVELVALDLDAVAAVQPLQVLRRRMLLGRVAGRVLARRRVPRFRGYRMLRMALRDPRQLVRTARGSFARARSNAAR